MALATASLLRARRQDAVPKRRDDDGVSRVGGGQQPCRAPSEPAPALDQSLEQLWERRPDLLAEWARHLQELAVKVLERGVKDADGGKVYYGTHKTLAADEVEAQEDASAWVASEDDGVRSFRWWCLVARVDRRRIREAIDDGGGSRER